MDVINNLEVGKKAPKIINAIIEIPKNSSIKYEIDKKTGLLKLDRMLFSSDYYPGDYGLIPKTHCEDGDPLDVIVITNKPLLPMTIAEVRVVGVLKMKDDGEQDDKIIGVYDSDPRYEEFKDLKNVPKHIIKEIKNFFETYKKLQEKKVKIIKMGNKNAAIKVIKNAQKLYKTKQN